MDPHRPMPVTHLRPLAQSVRVGERWQQRKIALALAVLWLCALGLAIALGHWIAVSQQPQSRNAIGRQLLASGQPEVAAFVFDSLAWQAVASYRAGRYLRAAEALAATHQTDNTTLYNVASAYAHLHRYADAIAALETVLARDPSHTDARHNLDVIRAAAERAREIEQAQNANSPDETERQPPNGDNQESDPSQAQSQSIVQNVKEDPPDVEEDPDLTMNESGGQRDESASSQPATGASASSGETQPDRDTDSMAAIIAKTDDTPPTQDDARSALPETPDASGQQARLGEKALADELLLRRIKDDPALVLEARFRTAWRARQANLTDPMRSLIGPGQTP